MHVCVYPRVLDALATARLLPSASFRRHNFSRLIIAVNHCCLPTVFLPSSPFVPLPAAAHAAQSQISYSQAQRVELHIRDGVKRRAVDGLAARSDEDCCLAPTRSAGDILVVSTERTFGADQFVRCRPVGSCADFTVSRSFTPTQSEITFCLQ